jgi:hypothetical protein
MNDDQALFSALLIRTTASTGHALKHRAQRVQVSLSMAYSAVPFIFT